MKTLKEALPYDFMDGEFENTRAMKMKDVEVIEEMDGTLIGWPGNEKFVYNWYKLSNGYAVGWNENPARGWSFPVVKIKGDHENG